MNITPNWTFTGPVLGSPTSLDYDPPFLYLSGKFGDRDTYTPVTLQVNANGAASTLEIKVNCRFHELDQYVTWGDRVELWARFGSGTTKRLFVGWVMEKSRELESDIESGVDGASVVAHDATCQLNRRFLLWEHAYGTAAFLLHRIVEGYDQYVYGAGMVPVFGSKVDRELIDLGDDLADIDIKPRRIGFHGEGVNAVITSVFRNLGSFLWYLDPGDDDPIRIRWVKRGEGPGRILSIGAGVHHRSDTPEIQHASLNEDASQIVNVLHGYGAHKRYETTSTGEKFAESDAMEAVWATGNIDTGSDDSGIVDIETYAKANPGKVGTDSVFKYTGRLFRLPRISDQFGYRRHHAARLRSIIRRYVTVEGGETKIQESGLNLYYRTENLISGEQDWRPYEGDFQILVETSLDSLTNSGSQYDPLDVQPEDLYVLLPEPAFYDRYSVVRTTENAQDTDDDGDPLYPDKGMTDTAEFMLTAVYDDRNFSENQNFGRVYARSDAQGDFPWDVHGALVDEGFAYEKQQRVEETYDSSGERVSMNYDVEVLRDDTPRLDAYLDEKVIQTKDPERRFEFGLWNADFSWTPGMVITRIKNSTDFQDVTWIVEGYTVELQRFTTTLILSDKTVITR